jgi:pilus assembly protein CpaF
MEEEIISMQEIFRFRRRGRNGDGVVEGDFEATGIRPRFTDALMARGIQLPPHLFAPVRRAG